VLLIVAALDREALGDLLHAAKGIGLGTLVEVHTAEELGRRSGWARRRRREQPRPPDPPDEPRPSLSLLPLILPARWRSARAGS